VAAGVDPAVRFDYNVTPHLVGNLGDLPFDGQTAITQRGLRTGPGCHYIGSGRTVPGADPERFAIGGEELPAAPFAGPKTEFLAMVPWVRPDGPRPDLERTSDALSAEGNGPLENDYLETAIVADLPFPPNPRRRSCATAPPPGSGAGAGSGARGGTRRSARLRVSVRPRRLRAGRRTAVRVYVRTWRAAGRGRSPERRCGSPGAARGRTVAAARC
jgi:hypothetical protein